MAHSVRGQELAARLDDAGLPAGRVSLVRTVRSARDHPSPGHFTWPCTYMAMQPVALPATPPASGTSPAPSHCVLLLLVLIIRLLLLTCCGSAQLLLHGWSPGPGLPDLVLRSGLFEVHEVAAAGIGSIICTRYGNCLSVRSTANRLDSALHSAPHI